MHIQYKTVKLDIACKFSRHQICIEDFEKDKLKRNWVRGGMGGLVVLTSWDSHENQLQGVVQVVKKSTEFRIKKCY
jgi:hypothetical protein